MFLVKEVDRLLETLANNTSDKRKKNAVMRISLPEIEGIELKRLNFAGNVRFPLEPNPSLNYQILNKSYRYAKLLNLDKRISKDRSYLTSNVLFFNLMKTLVLFRLAQIQANQYPSAKLIICDRIAYNYLMKLQRITSAASSFSSNSDDHQGFEIGLKNFIYKPPSNVTAVFLLSDIVDLFDREREPIVVVKTNKTDKKQEAHFNYPLIRRKFPFLKLSDLVVIVHDKSDLQIGGFSLESGREVQIIQILSQFARSSTFIELKFLSRLIGHPHQFYDNVMFIPPQTNSQNTQKNYYTSLPLLHLSSMVERIVYTLRSMNLIMQSICYRLNDPSGQAKAFAQLVATSVSSSSQVPLADSNYTRVLVLDRFSDLLGTLLHPLTYGAFLEQELHAGELDGVGLKLRVDTMSELDEDLQLEKLTDVLNSILKHTLSTTSKESDILKRKIQKSSMKSNVTRESLLTASATSQSVRRHLDIIKVVYKSLSEGYLLILKIESILDKICDRVRDLKEIPSTDEQRQQAEALQRVVSAFKQLTEMTKTRSSFRSGDLARLACAILEVANIFLIAQNRMKENVDSKATKIVHDIRSFVLRSKSVPKSVIESFDTTSKATCSSRSPLSFKKTVEDFYKNKLDADSFPTLRLMKMEAVVPTSILVIVFLGYLTPYELSIMKIFEASLTAKRQRTPDSILIMACGLGRPHDFLKLI